MNLNIFRSKRLLLSLSLMTIFGALPCAYAAKEPCVQALTASHEKSYFHDLIDGIREKQNQIRIKAEQEIHFLNHITGGNLFDDKIVAKISRAVAKFRDGGYNVMTKERHEALKAIEANLKQLKSFKSLGDQQISEIARVNIADSDRNFSRTSFGVKHDLFVAVVQRGLLKDKAAHGFLSRVETLGGEIAQLNESVLGYTFMLEGYPEFKTIKTADELGAYISALTGKIKTEIRSSKAAPADVIEEALNIAVLIRRNNMSEGSIKSMLEELYQKSFFIDYTEADRKALRVELGGDIQMSLDAEFALAQPARRLNPELNRLIETWKQIVYVK